MSRHRNVRRMNYDEEDDGYDDTYGRSVEDDFCVSPSVAEFIYDRNAQQHPMAAYISQENIPEEEISWELDEDMATPEDNARRSSTDIPNLGDVDEARLRSCLDEIHNIVGDTMPEKVLINTVIESGFDFEKALDKLLTSSEASLAETPKPQRERKDRRGEMEGVKIHNENKMHLPNSKMASPQSALMSSAETPITGSPFSLNLKAGLRRNLEPNTEPDLSKMKLVDRVPNGLTKTVLVDSKTGKLPLNFTLGLKRPDQPNHLKTPFSLSNLSMLKKDDVQKSGVETKSRLSQLADAHLNSRQGLNCPKPSLFKFALNKSVGNDALSSKPINNDTAFSSTNVKSIQNVSQGKVTPAFDLNAALKVKKRHKLSEKTMGVKDLALDSELPGYKNRNHVLKEISDDPRVRLMRELTSRPSLFAMVLCLHVKKTKWAAAPYKRVAQSDARVNSFDFLTPSPDAIVSKLNEKAFGPVRNSGRSTQSRSTKDSVDEMAAISNGDMKKLSDSVAALSIPSAQTVTTGFVPGRLTSSEQVKPESAKANAGDIVVLSTKENGQAKDEDIQVENGAQIPAALKPIPSRGRDAGPKVDVVAEYKKSRGGSKDLLNLVVIGHVDAGKSTLMGHLLCLVGAVSQKVLHKYEQESKKIGKASFMYAWVLDETGEERSRGVTMDVGYSKFETASKSVTLLDAPGHKDFIPNMITGAAQADVAVLVVDSTRGEFETGFETGGQTREHALLVRSLGVSQLVVAVNKLDNVNWSEERYREIVNTLSHFLMKQAGFKESDVTYIPCSGLTGENLVEPPKEERLKVWYSGSTLLEQIDKFKFPERPVSKPLRLCVSDVFKGQGSTLSVAGKIETGYVQMGDKVLLMPMGETAAVRGISMDDVPRSNAFAGDQVILSLSGVDMSNVTVGCVICDCAQPIRATNRFRARIVVFNIDTPITKGFQAVLHYQSLCEPVIIKKLISQLHKGTGETLKNNPRCLTKQTNAMVELEVSRPICVEEYKDFKELGRFMLRSKGATLAAGVVTQVL